jgi:hypothetical protein
VNDISYNLPRDLGDNLTLRLATAADTEALAKFNFRIHNENPSGQPDVSTMVLISQTWSYDGFPFGVGRPELIATDKAYRRRGLVRAQFDVLHAMSAGRGEIVQAITGIPWYYGQFGYEFALDLGGSRHLEFSKVKALPDGQEERYHLRPPTKADLPALDQLYGIHCASSLVSCVRDRAIWDHELAALEKRNINQRNLVVIEIDDGELVGYAAIPPFPFLNRIREIAVLPGHSLRSACLFLSRHLKTQATAGSTETAGKVSGITFNLGATHPAYEALDQELGQLDPPYAWYIRVPELEAFLELIGPALEERLAGSVMAGYSGALRLNFYQSFMTLIFERGLLKEISTYEPKDFWDGDAYFPNLTFLQLLFGRRSMDELKHAHTDCFTSNANAEAAVLINILFPRHHSNIVPLA